MNFPYGKAPFVILIIAIVSGVILLFVDRSADESADLSFVIFATTHYGIYSEVIPEFEKKHGVKIALQRVDIDALQTRLQSAFLSGSPVPDMVELESGSMGFFTKGPIKDVGFVDLSDRIRTEGLDQRLVNARFSLWSSRGHIFALPHDVHPVVLVYRRDIVESLGIDVGQLKTWDDFAAMGREVTKDLDGDGTIDRYALDMYSSGDITLRLLMLQRGGHVFDENGQLVMDSEINMDTMDWYLHQARGDDRIAFPAGWGQTLAKAVMDGLVLFYFAPDWRTKAFEMDSPTMAGKMAIMPLPAWEPGGSRTSVWGGTGLAITKECKNKELAWELAKFLYFNGSSLVCVGES